ncbi:nitroreductase family protein [uncultured Aquimarina sp.]|uniref:Acg family FMN-binding oxidoreductase n=1 Tax=uncultured Aquimarina sp. TaxID=575652 RepID=UPI00262376BE|nr:nitroreductase family protein [uncultured Aquimarina sp.]
MKTIKNNRIDEFKEIIHAATKAPSGHNTQPWNFKIIETGIEIHPDLSHELSVVDPNNRELYISIGCALENLLVAANRFHYDYSYEVLEENTNYFIKVDLVKSKSEKTDPLFSYIDLRQTNRSEYNKQYVPEKTIKELLDIDKEEKINIYSFKRGDAYFNTIKDYILEGNNIQMNDPGFKSELLEWIRFNAKDVLRNKDGLTYKVMGAPSLPKFIGKPIVRSFLNAKNQNKNDVRKINSSSHFIVFTTKSNTVPNWISLGITLERFLLSATKKRIANAYLNPPCEIETLANHLKESLPINQEYPNIIIRIGYAVESVAFSPRKDIETLIYN